MKNEKHWCHWHPQFGYDLNSLFYSKESAEYDLTRDGAGVGWKVVEILITPLIEGVPIQDKGDSNENPN